MLHFLILCILYIIHNNFCTSHYWYKVTKIQRNKTNVNSCVFSSVPPPSRPQDTGNWIQFWVVGCYVGCDFHLTCICVCSFLCITPRLTPLHWSQSRDVKHHRAVQTTHGITSFTKTHSSLEYSWSEMKRSSVKAIIWYEPFPVIFKGYVWCPELLFYVSA